MTDKERKFIEEVRELMDKYDIFIGEDSDEHNLVVFTNEDRTFYFFAITV